MFGVNRENAIIKLCAQGIERETQGDIESASDIFCRAWDESANDFERSIAAHYVARVQTDAKQRLLWNEVALSAGVAAGDERAGGFYASLYLNVAKSHEDLEHWKDAAAFYGLAEQTLHFLPEGPYRTMVANAIARGAERVRLLAI